MKIAHLILAYKCPAQVARLLAALAHPEATYYIYLDKKTDLAPFAYLQNQTNVHFIRNRQAINWGGYSLTKAMLDGCREILSSPARYDFVNIMSGQDYPLKPAAEVHEFFRQHIGFSFMESQPPGSAWWQANIGRVEQYHFTDFTFSGRYALQKVLNACLPKRRFPLSYTLYGGNMSTWATLSRMAAAYVVGILDAHPRLRRFAALTWGSDEFLIPTILLNSPLKATIINDSLRYINWTGGGHSPKILRSADLPQLQASAKFWARKFDISLDAAVLDQLDQARQNAPVQVGAAH